MNLKLLFQKYWTTVVVSSLFLVLSSYLLSYTTQPPRLFSQTDLVWDLIWLDVWSLSFIVAIVVLWLAPIARNLKIWLSLGCLSCFAVILVGLMLNGTPFGYNGYWGDQKFRTALVLHFLELDWNSDFFYKGLPNFYPPLYYRALTVIAWLFDLKAYQMMKVGVMTLGAIAPVLVYLSWRKLVSGWTALIISLMAVFFCRDGYTWFIYGPHQFIGNMFFIPWWLYYIERVRGTADSWRFYLLGGLFGALIFSAYFYAFFIGALLIVARVTLLRHWSFFSDNSHFSFSSAWRLLGLSALFSAPYWLPVLQSIAQFGSDRSRGGWHHEGSVGVSSIFSDFTIEGVVALGALVYVSRRFKKPLFRGLLTLVGATMAFYFLGSITGAFGWSLNVVKARDFMVFLAIPIVGLAISAGWRWSRRETRLKYPFIVLCLCLSLYAVNQINAVTKTGNMIKARKSVVPTWGTDGDEMVEATGRVFLTDHEELFAFYPVYTFISKNEHYTHPASEYKSRYDLLYLLQSFSDPELFHLALTYNRYDKVEHFMPSEREGTLRINIGLSNYPNRWLQRSLKYSLSLIADSSLFRPLQGKHHYQLLDAVYPEISYFSKHPPVSVTDSLLALSRLRTLRSHLTQEGKKKIDLYLGISWLGWVPVTPNDKPVKLAGELDLISGSSVIYGDSLLFHLRFEAGIDFEKNYKLYVHQFLPDGSWRNLDFLPDERTNWWKQMECYDVWHWIPMVASDHVIHTGFFIGADHLGGKIRIPIGENN